MKAFAESNNVPYGANAGENWGTVRPRVFDQDR